MKVLVLILILACGGTADLGPGPATLRVLAPMVGILTVRVVSSAGDTTIVAPACLQWMELYVTPLLEVWYRDYHVVTRGPVLWPQGLPNAIAQIVDSGVLEIAAVTGQPRC